MTIELSQINREYGSAMQTYLERGGEVALAEAYEIGRRALLVGLGILDIIAIHQNALDALVIGESGVERSRRAAAAGEFCRELLSPFEMTLRGYQQANEHLQRLNEALTQQKHAVELANRELESFSYSVSHDLRAPLRSIDGFSQALLEDAADKLDDQGRRYLSHVRHSAQQMAELIDDLLELARVARSELVRSRVDVTQIARRVTDLLRSIEPGRRVEVVIQEGMVADADHRLLELVLQNLIGNAWKFTSKNQGARIECRCDQQAGRLVYSVIDNGAGFDMTYAKKLFGAFQRLHAASEFEGTGIGLATVQRIVHRHGGEVWADAAVDRGAKFFFTLQAGKS